MLLNIMSNSNTESVDVEYYYNRKSKFFEELKEQPEYSRISLSQFLNYLHAAYFTNCITTDAGKIELYLNNNLDWTKITRSEIFSEILDVNEASLYRVITEINDLEKFNVNKEYEIFDDCNYFFSIPSGATLTISCDSLEAVHKSITDMKSPSETIELKNNPIQNTINKTSFQKQRSLLTKPSVNNSLSKEHLIKKKLNQLKPLSKNITCKSDIASKLNEQTKCNSDYSIKDLNRKKNLPKFPLKKVQPVYPLNVSFTKQTALLKEDDKKTKNFNKKTNSETNAHEKNDSEIDDETITNIQSPIRPLCTPLLTFCQTKEIQKLTEMLNNTQTDTNVLEWIYQWLICNCPLDKRVSLSMPNSTTLICPRLDFTIVVPVLAYASVLNIHSLIDLCLHYCKTHMNEILKTSSDFSCIDETTLTKLSDMFSNVDVEALKDKNDKIHSSLFKKLIVSLTNPEPEPWKGHFSSLAYLFKCIECQKLVLDKISATVPCLEKNMQISTNGKVINLHERDTAWNLTQHIGNLIRELRCWRRVYWRLWAECHFLYCMKCHSHYSLYTYNRCHHHPDHPKFILKNGREEYVGYYPCCGMKAFKYESVWFPEKGCKTKNHSPFLKNNRASADIMKLFELYQPLMFSNNTDSCINSLNSSTIKSNKNEKHKTRKTKKSRKKVVSQNKGKWKGFKMDSNTKRNGLIDDAIEKAKEVLGLKIENETYFNKLVEFETDSSDTIDEDERNQIRYSIRFNQDQQRTYEEKTMLSVNALLCSRTSCQNALSDLTNKLALHDNFLNKGKPMLEKNELSTSSTDSLVETLSNNSLSTYSSTINSNLRILHSRTTSIWNSYTPLAGIFVRIESEWKDTHTIPINLLMQSHKFPLQSMTSKFQSSSQMKSCLRCHDQNIKWNMAYSYSRKSAETATLTVDAEDEFRMWVFDARSQELDYRSAAYEPVATKKEYQYLSRYINLDWNSIIELERYWNAFLGLFFENEISPSEEEHRKTEKKK